MLNSDEFRVSRLQEDTLDFYEFFCWVHGQKSKSATKLLELAGAYAEKRSEGSRLISVFSAAETQSLRELGTKQMRHLFSTSKSAQVLGNADFRVLEMFHPVLDELATLFSFLFAGAYSPPNISSSGRKKKAESISRALETTSP